MATNNLIIDVTTKDKNQLIRRLNRLVSTTEAHDGGMYHQDVLLSQVHVETTKTEDEIDSWLYNFAGNIDYVGVTEA